MDTLVKRDEALRALISRLERPLRVLQLGAQDFQWALQLSREVTHWTCIEDRPEKVQSLQAQIPGSASQFELLLDTLFRPRGRSFELVYLAAATEQWKPHLLEPLVRCARDHLAPGGCIYAALPVFPTSPSLSHYLSESDYCQFFGELGLLATFERDEVALETALGCGYTPMLQWLLEWSPLPRISHFVLFPADPARP